MNVTTPAADLDAMNIAAAPCPGAGDTHVGESIYRSTEGAVVRVMYVPAFAEEEVWASVFTAGRSNQGEQPVIVTDPLRTLALAWDEGNRFRAIRNRLWARGWFDAYSSSYLGPWPAIPLAALSRARISSERFAAFERSATAWLSGQQESPHFTASDLIAADTHDGLPQMSEHVRRGSAILVSPWRRAAVQDSLARSGYTAVSA